MFNRGADDELIIRKASAHGLGHLLPPYKEEVIDDDADEDGDAQENGRPSGVDLWQEDFWRAIIKAAESENPRHVALDWHKNLWKPAASCYAATKPEILNWFKAYNKERDYDQQVKPFNFLLTFQGKRREDLQFEDPDRVWNPREHEAKATAPYDKDPQKALAKLFDRDTGEPSEPSMLRHYKQALRQYHIHPEAKFLQGRQMDSGPTRRRHVFADIILPIGKEANEIEEDEAFGADEDSTVNYGLSPEQRAKMIAVIAAAPKRRLARTAGLSDHTIDNAVRGEVADSVLAGLFEAAQSITLKTQCGKS